MSDPDDLDARIARHRAEAKQIADECAAMAALHERLAVTGSTARTRAEARRSAVEMRERERGFREQAGARPARGLRTKGLRDQSQGGTVEPMQTAHRLARARGAAPDDPFVEAMTRAGMTLGDLADRVGIPKSLLSMYRGGKRPITRLRADRIEKEIGWPASDWPKFAD